MNQWQHLNNWFVKNAILNLKMIQWSLINYENTIIKHIIDMLIVKIKAFIAVFINCFINDEWTVN
jgi:hypothetical protein